MRKQDVALMSAGAVVAASVLGFGWTVAARPDASGPLAAVAAFVLGGLTVAAVAAVLCRTVGRRHTDAKKFLEHVLRLEDAELASPEAIDEAPRLDSSSPWRPMLHQILDRMSSAAARVAEAENLRNATEIRGRRRAGQLERISSILGSLPEPILAVDAFDDLILANSSAESLFSFRAHDAERRALNNLVRCEKLVQLLSDTRRRSGTASRTDELEIEHPNGERRWYSVTASSLGGVSRADDPAETSNGAVAVLRDISVQKEIQQRNAEFVSSVSHEMKTPLAGIKAYVELLADGDAEDEATREEFLSVINAQADRLKRLIDNLLNLARIEAGVVKVAKESQSLNAILEEAFGVLQPAAEAKQVTLIKDLSPLYLGAYVDRDLMLQAAINLLSNAVKYTPSGGTVHLRSRSLDDQITFEVEDTGVGLSPEDCEKVFEKFYRVEHDKNMAAGTGLGLPLAKHIAEDVHGGHLTVSSIRGKGSVFAISLPAATHAA